MACIRVFFQKQNISAKLKYRYKTEIKLCAFIGAVKKKPSLNIQKRCNDMWQYTADGDEAVR